VQMSRLLTANSLTLSSAYPVQMSRIFTANSLTLCETSALDCASALDMHSIFTACSLTLYFMTIRYLECVFRRVHSSR
jgi:hypothetical protein